MTNRDIPKYSSNFQYYKMPLTHLINNTVHIGGVAARDLQLLTNHRRRTRNALIANKRSTAPLSRSAPQRIKCRRNFKILQQVFDVNLSQILWRNIFIIEIELDTQYAITKTIYRV